MPAPLWYFAYGSNMHSGTIRERRGIEYQRAIPARAVGWRLVFDKPSLVPGGSAAANIVADRGAVTPGVLFAITPDELAHIELTEGVLIGNYRRVDVAVQPLDNAETPPGIAASLSSDRRDPSALPSIRYMGIVIAGAVEHRLPAEHIRFLRSVPAEREAPEIAALQPFIDDALRRRR